MRTQSGIEPAAEQPEDERRRWLTGDHVGVTLLWLVVVASVAAIALMAWQILQPAHCQCGG
jgi:hypothetical protein